MVLVASQLVIRRLGVWLPKVLSERAIEHAGFTWVATSVLPWIVRPRHWDVFASSPDSAVGTASIVMAIRMLPAIPFANSLPAAPDITMALGLSGHDGAWLAVAVVASIVSTVIEVSIFAAGSFAISILFRKRVP